MGRKKIPSDEKISLIEASQRYRQRLENKETIISYGEVRGLERKADTMNKRSEEEIKMRDYKKQVPSNVISRRLLRSRRLY